MVYDEDRQVIVLFGGLATDQVGSGLADTWEWDGTNWTEVTTANAPAPRGIHGAMAYDSVQKKVVLRGSGTFPGQTIFGDTWTYDGTNWTEVTGTGPSARVAPAIASDKASSQIVLFGGGTWNPYYGDTWTLSGTTRSELTPTPAPSQRQSARMIYDSTRSLVVLFGGDDGSLLNDLWEWNGTGWAQVSVTGPPPRCCFAFAHDQARRSGVVRRPGQSNLDLRKLIVDTLRIRPRRRRKRRHDACTRSARPRTRMRRCECSPSTRTTTHGPFATPSSKPSAPDRRMRGTPTRSSTSMRSASTRCFEITTARTGSTTACRTTCSCT